MTGPTRVIFACDESGAKGYANQDEQYTGEVGVFAGILIPEDCVPEKLPPFQKLITKYTPSSGKLHIADLPDAQKDALRRDTYAAIQDSGLPCFWYAIHVAGFRRQYKEEQQLLDEARKATASSTVKRGSSRSNPASMHQALFTGLYSHLVAFLEERGKADVCIEIRSDQVDAPILKEFENAAIRLLSTKPLVSRSTGFDTVTRSIVRGQVSIQVNYSPELAIKSVVRELVFNPVSAGDGLVLAADVLANSLNHLFKHRPPSELYGDLNRPEAVLRHPLAKNLDAFYNWGSGDLVGDRLYRHPKAPPS
ncbi:hypothetical protein [Roseicella sp. DB1501]|uniref:hypothetical protein n=1 Tax=Roseicella sp. DB1501 TaxID=2730925 RepID=UPI0014916AEE|nr:hypothetical protein [Roseicella sp. DB1501]NOG73937.1 hypothetical protein [Roseicella sp. DB1501]